MEELMLKHEWIVELLFALLMVGFIFGLFKLMLDDMHKEAEKDLAHRDGLIPRDPNVMNWC